jgi:hypothetical protein
MESALQFMLDLVALALAVIAIMAALTVAFGNVRALRHPVARIVVTPLLAVLGLWILWNGIAHMVSG